jgi:hypothetical protein
VTPREPEGRVLLYKPQATNMFLYNVCSWYSCKGGDQCAVLCWVGTDLEGTNILPLLEVLEQRPCLQARPPQPSHDPEDWAEPAVNSVPESFDSESAAATTISNRSSHNSLQQHLLPWWSMPLCFHILKPKSKKAGYPSASHWSSGGMMMSSISGQ